MKKLSVLAALFCAILTTSVQAVPHLDVFVVTRYDPDFDPFPQYLLQLNPVDVGGAGGQFYVDGTLYGGVGPHASMGIGSWDFNTDSVAAPLTLGVHIAEFRYHEFTLLTPYEITDGPEVFELGAATLEYTPIAHILGESVPDGGATSTMLGLAFMGAVAYRRFRS